MDEAARPAVITIRPAVSGDADGIALTYLESAEYHASLDPERYSSPAVETILARYREPTAAGGGITLAAVRGGEIVGFVDAGLDRSPDPMHRDMIYCHIAEIAVSSRHQNQGIGGTAASSG
jgi:ribosomal protein S18 acetylase RimI-like enzyme